MKKQVKNAGMQALKNVHIYQLDHVNQFIIDSDDFRLFQSYKSLVAIYDKKQHLLLLGRDWDYSNTTLKHLYLFINDYCCLPEIDDILYNASNKKAAMYKAIKNGLVLYDPEMR